MKTRDILKNLMLIERNKEWLSSDIPLRDKLVYYPSMGSSYVRMASGRGKHISYFGKPFSFDNPATPFNLQNYPFEITNKVLRHMAIIPKTIMDIGGNIGQFPITIAAIIPEAQIDALEPNGDIYKILEKNVKPYPNISTYNVGVGKSDPKAKMYYEPTRSGIGSLIVENAGNPDNLKEIPITLIDDVPKTTKRASYDLITIDVEGYEMDVIKCLSNVKTKYLFMEVSTQSRSKTYLHSELFEHIRTNLGDFDIVYSLGHSSVLTPTFDILFEFHDRTQKPEKTEKPQKTQKDKNATPAPAKAKKARGKTKDKKR
jgi:FkbM family methyltransferase